MPRTHLNCCAMDDKQYLGWQKITYEYLLLLPIFVIVSTTYFVAALLSVLRLFSWKAEWHVIQKLKEADRKVISYMLETFFNMLLHREGIRDLNRMRSKQKDVTQRATQSRSKEKSCTCRCSTTVVKPSANVGLLNLPVHSSSPGHAINADSIMSSKWAMSILSWYVASVASLALVIFWESFILEQRTGHTGEGRADCYSQDRNGTYILVNTSDIDTGRDPRHQNVKCFAFALDFPTALVSVAGILFVASNGFTFLMFLIMLVVDGIESCCRRMSMCVILAMAEYIFVGLVVYTFVIRYELSGRVGSINLVIQEYLIITALIMGVTTPWLLLLWAFVSWSWKRSRAVSISGDPRVDRLVNLLNFNSAIV